MWNWLSKLLGIKKKPLPPPTPIKIERKPQLVTPYKLPETHPYGTTVRQTETVPFSDLVTGVLIGSVLGHGQSEPCASAPEPETNVGLGGGSYGGAGASGSWDDSSGSSFDSSPAADFSDVTTGND